VVKTRVGYTGGSTRFPTYHNLADHTEVFQVDYDPNITDYNALLKMFWKHHNITTPLRRQYMSAIFYHDDEQKKLAEETMTEVQKKTVRKVATKVLPLETFYDAEGYHQKYLLKRHHKVFRSLNLSDEEVLDSHVAARLNGYLNGDGCSEQLLKEVYTWGLNNQQIDYIISTVESDQKPGASCGFS